MQTKPKFEITREELKAVILLYQLKCPFMTTDRIYSRWKLGKLNLLLDYKIWDKNRYDDLMKGDDDRRKNKFSQ